MNKFSSFKAVLFYTISFIFIFTGCEKDIAGEIAGNYTGYAETYTMGVSKNFPDTRVTVLKLGKTTVKLDFISTSPVYNLTIEETLNKHGTFGTPYYSPRGTALTFGEEGRFFGDSLTYSLATTDSSGFTIFYNFKGCRK